MDGHLGRWGQQFCSQVERESRHMFYRSVAHFAGVLIKLEGSNEAETDIDQISTLAAE
jgi:TorA maturation chaperone TorD